jgi:ubiquitin carboxyl-terminal hydrolase 8
MQEEKEIKSGIPLGQCLDLYTKKQKIDDYSCDNCNSKTIAIIDTKLSRIPDILIVHLKRFAYHGGYLEKIEDLVTFPLNNLDISKHLSRFKKKSQVN